MSGSLFTENQLPPSSIATSICTPPYSCTTVHLYSHRPLMYSRWGFFYYPLDNSTPLDVRLVVSNFHSSTPILRVTLELLQSVLSTCWSTIRRSLLECLAHIGPGGGGVLLRASTGRLEGRVSLQVGDLKMKVSLAMETAPLWATRGCFELFIFPFYSFRNN